MRLGVVGADRQRPVETCDRLIASPKLVEHETLIAECQRMVGLDRQRFAEAAERLFAALKPVKDETEVRPRLDVTRLRFQYPTN